MRARAVATLSSAVLLVTAVPSSDAVARPDAPISVAPGTAQTKAKGAVHSVTLITGDRVVLTELPQGKHSIAIDPGPGREGMTFAREAEPGAKGRTGVRVTPLDAAPLVASGRLDPRLFDITGLVRQGLADAKSPDLPLITRYRNGRLRADARAAVTKGAKEHRLLPSINGSAVREHKSHAGTFWASVTLGKRGQAAHELAPGLTRIWLDGRARLMDDESNAQIGAPTAWQAGFTGKGVKVAVLDGGYDRTHPDLEGRVTAAKDFTGDADGPKDEHGHGTHVAGTVAGTGKAAGGAYKGVAPDAELLVGRVCGTEECPESAVIAGMEWAAGQARIVNMSLGSDPSDGTDPLSVAATNLTASTGALFVAAAGNRAAPSSIGGPAAADAVLAVGSVNKKDEESWFSSKGPRRGDSAVKPDLSAPGEDIVAARAAGTSLGTPVNDHYTSLSGTSMAAPHVAGAAAILAQQHPDWKAEELKTALTSSSDPVGGLWVFEHGTGRLDVARAVGQTVRATPSSLSFGHLAWPYADQPAKTRTVTYHNDGDVPVTLTPELALRQGGKPVDPKAVTLDKQQVTIPAHGSSTVDVTIHPKVLATATAGGQLAGRVTATDADRKTVVRTGVGLITEPEAYDLTVKLIDRDGKPATDELPHLWSIADLNPEQSELPELEFKGGTATVRLAKGKYGLAGAILTPRGATPEFKTSAMTLAAAPKLSLERDLTLTFDARKGHRVTTTVDAPDPVRSFVEVDFQFSRTPTDTWLAGFATYFSNEISAIPVTADDPATFAFGYSTVLTSPANSAVPYAYNLAFPFLGRIPEDLSFRARNTELAALRTRYRAQGVDAALGTRAEAPLFLPGQQSFSGGFTDVRLPDRRTEFYSPSGVKWHGLLVQRTADQPQQGPPEGAIIRPWTAYAAGSVHRQDWNKAVFGPDLSEHSWSAQVARHDGDNISVNLPSFAPGETQHSGMPGMDNSYVRGSITLSLEDGSGSGTAPSGVSAGFTVPAGEHRFVLDVDARRDRGWTALAPQVRTVWKFSSKTVNQWTYEALPVVRIQGEFDDSNRAVESSWLALELTAATQADAAPSDITQVSLDVSTDDGATWKQAWVQGKNEDGTWRAAVFNPRKADTTGYVSLRARATNTAGNTVETTVIRAYGLKAAAG
ncbi:S8 family serine peptidase [Streptomyces sp. KR80]|uniref:S8 family serine peptidase n=1 Tax=Streptomyces sp. KR80 TaxID=3457426 RepID=UPI003FD0E14F